MVDELNTQMQVINDTSNSERVLHASQVKTLELKLENETTQHRIALKQLKTKLQTA